RPAGGDGSQAASPYCRARRGPMMTRAPVYRASYRYRRAASDRRSPGRAITVPRGRAGVVVLGVMGGLSFGLAAMCCIWFCQRPLPYGPLRGTNVAATTFPRSNNMGIFLGITGD